jgi:hypothetical protein
LILALTNMKPKRPRKHLHDRRKFLTAGLLGLAAEIPSITHAAEGSKANASNSPAFEIRGLNPPDAPAADLGYTPGILAAAKDLVEKTLCGN